MKWHKQSAPLCFYAVAALFCWAVLILLSSAGPAYLVADVPYRLPGLGVAIPSSVHQWVVPLFLVLLYWRARRQMMGAATLGIFTVAVITALAAVWLVTLARHDRVLSLMQGGMLFWAVWAALASLCFRWAIRTGVLAFLSILMALGFYGAIWGETRCDEKSEVGCLTTAGPRVWVPEMLAGIGLSAFADLRGADLRGANLSGRDLRYADLRGAELEGANLSDSNLRRAMLDGISARGSNWRAAHLDGASFAGADLTGANLGAIHAYRVDFRGADLSKADIRNASLSHALLGGAGLNGTMLSGSYMRFVSGLVDSQLRGACGDRETLLPPGFSIRPCMSAQGF